MIRLRVQTPSRLHFGLLAWNPRSTRQFGGVGLMIEGPGLRLTAEPSSIWSADGPLADRALRVAGVVADRLEAEGPRPSPIRFRIERAAPEHVGLGTGTQLGLAVARAIAELSGRPGLPAATLASLSGRGLRSGIGLHGFDGGGLIVDGGRRAPVDATPPPLLARLAFPPEWSVLVVVPEVGPGLHGPGEVRAFDQLPPFPEALTDRLCRLVLLGLLPAVLERDIDAFGEALAELQAQVGRGFAPAQGGIFGRPELGPIVEGLRDEGLKGVGQSSWGPTLYAFSPEPADRRSTILDRVRARFDLPPDAITWTSASPDGARASLV